jgi:hypothetical protein
MSKQTENVFPQISDSYIEEFGEIDLEVYQVAKQLWIQAEKFILRILDDSPKGVRLMLKASVNVSRVHRKNPSSIKNLNSYLFRSYKNLVLGELKKKKKHRSKLDVFFREQKTEFDENEETLNRRILINELRFEMDDWTREVFDLLRIGYTYQELVPRFGSAANVIRSKFSKKIVRLARKIQIRAKVLD